MSRVSRSQSVSETSETSDDTLSSSHEGNAKVVVVGSDSYKLKEVSKWNVKEVCGWLNAHGYDEYAQAFVDEIVDGESLITLSAADLTNLGFKKLGIRNKILGKIAKLKETGQTDADSQSQAESRSESGGGEVVTVKALFKQKATSLQVSSTITLDSLLDKLAQEFGGVRVKLRIVDEDGEQIAVGNDAELYNVLAGESQVEFQCVKDLKALSGGALKSSSKSTSSAAPAAPAAKAIVSGVDFELFETLMDGYCVIDEDGVIAYVNASLERMFGYSRRKLIGENVKVLMPDSYAKKHDTYLARYQTTRVKHVIDKNRVVMGKASNGAMFPISLAVVEKKTPAGATYFIGTLKLATESGDVVSSNDAVDEFAGVRKTLEALQEAAVVINETGRIAVFNSAAEKLFGHKAANIIDQPVETLMPSPHKENHSYYLSRYVATGKKIVMGSSRDVQALRADGTLISVNLALSEEKSKSGDPLFIALLTPSVKRATMATAPAVGTGAATSATSATSGGGETLLQQLRKTINAMSTAGFIVNDKGVLHAFNSAASKLLGHELIDVVGRSVSPLLVNGGADGDQSYAYLRTFIGKDKDAANIALRNKDGAQIDMNVAVSESVEAGPAGKKFLLCLLHMTSGTLAAKKTKRKKKSDKLDGSTTSSDRESSKK